jgi:hypothetical protein
MANLNQHIEITLVSVEAVTIHGSPYYNVHFRTDNSEAVNEMRINPEAFYLNPKPGDRVAVSLLMGNVMGAVKIG